MKVETYLINLDGSDRLVRLTIKATEFSFPFSSL
jgi:hypothetical protein